MGKHSKFYNVISENSYRIMGVILYKLYTMMMIKKINSYSIHE